MRERSTGMPLAIPPSMQQESGNPAESAVSLKPDGKMCRIREQILRDSASGLTFQFEVDPQGRTRFRIFGEAMPGGNWEVGFDDGKVSFTGTSLIGTCRPAWMTSVEDL